VETGYTEEVAGVSVKGLNWCGPLHHVAKIIFAGRHRIIDHIHHTVSVAERPLLLSMLLLLLLLLVVVVVGG